MSVAHTATLAQACAIGAPLLAEHLVNVMKPAQRAKEVAVREWARQAGFRTYRDGREAVKRATKYK